MSDDPRLADLLAALSLTTDLAMGQPPEKSIRSTVVAMAIADHLGIRGPDATDVFYTTLLKHVGCTATLHEELQVFGPHPLAMRRISERTDIGSIGESLGLLAATGRGAGLSRARYLARAAVGGKRTGAAVMRAVCEVATRMAERLGLGPGVVSALYQSLERWDGKGEPQHLRGGDVAVAARVAEPATQAVIFHWLGGLEAALAMTKRRSGGWFDPAVAEAFRAIGADVLERLDAEDPWTAVLESEPEPVQRVTSERLDRVASAFADMVDLATPFTIGHSPGVADLGAAAAQRLGLRSIDTVRRAALFHDIGRVAVGPAVWEKPGPLTTAEWEQVRLHPYTTERILSRSVQLAPIARIAGMHHERRDGSGYHRGALAAEIPPEGRVLAAADAFQAMTQDRPHRAAFEPGRAAEVLFGESRAGRLDPDCVSAVVECAGQPHRPPRASWPAGLTEREVEVLRLVARGLSNRAVAATLVISPRTAEHHVQHIYGKIGLSTRAGAAMFAMEHGLMRD